MNAGVFRYEAVDGKGVRSAGDVIAATSADAYRSLAARGLTPVSLRAGGSANARGGFREKDLASLTHQLSAVLASGVSLAEGIRAVAAQYEPGRARSILESLAADVESGKPFSQAIAAQGDTFGEIYVETIRAAEASSSLGPALTFLAENIERSSEIRQQVRGALSYPVIVFCVLSLAVLFMILVVVPRFESIYASRGVELPALTQGLIAVSNAIRGWWMVLVPALAAGAWWARTSLARPEGRAALERWLVATPGVGSILTDAAVARFARVLGLASASGCGVIEAVRMAGRASGSFAIARDADLASESMRRGKPFPEAMSGCRSLPPFARRLLGSGADATKIEPMCKLVARQCEREATVAAKAIATTAEPVLVVLIASVVLTVALAIFLPMWDMVKLVG
jgi:type II secretory pathway component PulF